MAKVYFLTMILTFVISHYGINNKYRSEVISKISALLIFVILVFVSGFRTGIGDTFFYKHTYTLLVENPDLLINAKDPGFTLFLKLLISISKDPQMLIFTTSFISNLFIVLALYNYCRPFELGIFLYFGTLLYYVTMNGIRQSLVAAILFWAVKYIINNEWRKYFVIVVLLFFFHQSALIFIPLYFLVRKEAWSRVFWITLCSSLMFVVLFKPLLGTIVSILDKTSYNNYGQDMLINTETVNLTRVLILLIPIILAYFVRDKLKKEWPESRIFIYMSLFNFIFMLLGTQYLYFYRLCIYFDLFNLILIPRLLYLFGKQRAVTLYIYILIFYSIFSWYQVNQWHENYFNIIFL